MAFVFELPEIGEGVVEGEVVAWKVKVGDKVMKDQPFCDIMTDKATVEISSPRSGTVTKLYGQPGDIVKIHAPLAEMDDSDAPVAAIVALPATAAPPALPASPRAISPKDVSAPPNAPPRGSVSPEQVLTAPPAPTPGGPARAAPAVRRHAREEGLDIQQIPGSGPNGRVTHADVDALASGGSHTAPLPLVAPSLPQVTPSGSESRVKIIGMRRKIAEQMVKSKHTAPHFTYVEEIDCTRLVELRERLKPRAEKHGVKLTFIPIIMKACSVVFREFPNVNAVMDEQNFELIVKGDHHIGVATDTPMGLMVPVVKNVEQKSILRIAAELADLSDRTRAGKARLDELTGGTFTVTGVGSIGGVMATPILNVPEVGILGVNAIRDQAVVRQGQIVARKMMFLSPSFDHRVIDGAVAARFTAALKAVLEEPEALLLELA